MMVLKFCFYVVIIINRFIDANKDQYGVYYEKLLRLLRPGGVIAVDNVIWDCRILDAHAQDKDTVVRLHFVLTIAVY